MPSLEIFNGCDMENDARSPGVRALDRLKKIHSRSSKAEGRFWSGIGWKSMDTDAVQNTTTIRDEPARQCARELANKPEFANAQRQRKKVEALFAEPKNQIGG